MKSKRCPKCKKELPATIEYFYTCKRYKDGLRPNCRKCNTKICREYYQTEQGKLAERKSQLKGDYGITLADYDRMFKQQKGRCKICNQSETRKIKGVIFRLCVDHNHKTGKVRGLLCTRCNLIIGHAKDNMEILQNTINYLKEELL